MELSVILKIFGAPLVGPKNVFCNNNGVVKNMGIPKSTVLKKHNSIYYHSVHEDISYELLRVIKKDTNTNLVDLLTKLVTYARKKALIGSLLYDC